MHLAVQTISPSNLKAMSVIYPLSHQRAMRTTTSTAVERKFYAHRKRRPHRLVFHA